MELFGLKARYAAMGESIERAMLRAARSTNWIGGGEVTELESALCAYTGVKHCVTCASGTDALALMLRAAGIKEGGAVFCPSFTFAATAEAIVLCGATPVFCDVDDSLTLSLSSLGSKIAKVKADGRLLPAAVLAVDLYGNAADRDALDNVCKSEGLPLFVDAAQSFGALWRGKSALSYCRGAAVSFFPTKPLGALGDGGAVFTDDDKLAEIIRSLCWHGAGRDKYENIRVGTNSRLDAIQAAVLKEELKTFPRELERKKELKTLYDKYLPSQIIRAVIKNGAESALALYTVRFESEEKRDAAKSRLNTLGIDCGIYYRTPLHLQPAYREYSHSSLPFSELAAKTVLSLPMHAYLADEDVYAVCEALKEVV